MARTSGVALIGLFLLIAAAIAAALAPDCDSSSACPQTEDLQCESCADARTPIRFGKRALSNRTPVRFGKRFPAEGGPDRTPVRFGKRLDSERKPVRFGKRNPNEERTPVRFGKRIMDDSRIPLRYAMRVPFDSSEVLIPRDSDEVK